MMITYRRNGMTFSGKVDLIDKLFPPQDKEYLILCNTGFSTINIRSLDWDREDTVILFDGDCSYAKLFENYKISQGEDFGYGWYQYMTKISE